MTTLFSKIKEVTELAAISGHEAPVRAYLREKLTPHVDEVVTDGLGGISVSSIQKLRMPRVFWSHLTWTKLVLWSVRLSQTELSVWLKSVAGILWWSAANASNSLLVTVVKFQ